MLGIVASTGSIPEQLANEILPLFFSNNTIANAADAVENFRLSLVNWPAESIGTIVQMGHAIFERTDFLREAKELQAPTLIMVGDQDRSRPVDESKHMQMTIPCSKLAGGHLLKEISGFRNTSLSKRTILPWFGERTPMRPRFLRREIAHVG